MYAYLYLSVNRSLGRFRLQESSCVQALLSPSRQLALPRALMQMLATRSSTRSNKQTLLPFAFFSLKRYSRAAKLRREWRRWRPRGCPGSEMTAACRRTPIRAGCLQTQDPSARLDRRPFAAKNNTRRTIIFFSSSSSSPLPSPYLCVLFDVPLSQPFFDPLRIKPPFEPARLVIGHQLFEILFHGTFPLGGREARRRWKKSQVTHTDQPTNIELKAICKPTAHAILLGLLLFFFFFFFFL